MVANSYRSDEHGIAPNQDIIADRSRVFTGPVVVASYCSRTNVDVLSYVGIAKVAEVAYFNPTSEMARFNFDVVSDVSVLLNMRPLSLIHI